MHVLFNMNGVEFPSNLCHSKLSKFSFELTHFITRHQFLQPVKVSRLIHQRDSWPFRLVI